MVSSSEEIAMIDRPQYESQVLDHLGLVAGMFDELGIGEVLDQATQQDPQTRDLSVGEAVKRRAGCFIISSGFTCSIQWANGPRC